MNGDHTKNLWNFHANPSAMVIPGQVLTIGGIEVAFIGLGLDQSAYFWLGPGNARFMRNEELEQFGLAVLSCFGISAELKRLKVKHGA